MKPTKRNYRATFILDNRGKQETVDQIVDGVKKEIAAIQGDVTDPTAPDRLFELLESTYGEVEAVPVDFRRYVGAQIGIHNPQGEKVGQVSHLTNREYLFVAGPGAGRIVQDATLSMAGAAPSGEGKF